MFKNIIKNNLWILLTLVLITELTSFAAENNAELKWPREIETEKSIVTIYQPQLELFKADTLEGRMAISIKPKEGNVLFCAVWFKAKMETDMDARTVTLESVEIPKVHFPDFDNEAKIKKFTELLVEEIASWNIVISLDRLVAGLEEIDNIKKKSENLNNSPPDIYFRTSPATLITIDGDPIIKGIDNSNLEYVVNTPFFIVKEKGNKSIYIKGGKFWYTSDKILSGWKETTKVPSSIEKLAEQNKTNSEIDSITASMTEAPDLIVVANPSELIVTNGKPDYQAIEGTSLLYVRNSESDIIMDINSQEHYVLLAGRWYHSKTLEDGDWEFKEPKELPEDFIKIPENSDMADVRVSVPNTPEAEEALLEQSIPQTATVDRKTATVKIRYDGNPKFKRIEDTEVDFAVNSDKTVLRIKDKYYCVDDAIWFVSDNATGPWMVSDVRPDEVNQIPPESEVYNVKYVYIFNSTPEEVCVGYYPGYTYSYVYGGVVVYGTGYHYAPWYGHYYFPRPVTWGFGVHYNPYTGWGFHIGFSFGWIGWRFHPFYRPYWGPRGYHAGYRHGLYRGYHHGVRRGFRAGYIAASRRSRANVYRNHRTGIKRTGNIRRDRATMQNRKARLSKKPNNLYADRKGNIYQRNKDGSWTRKTNRASSIKSSVVKPQSKQRDARQNYSKRKTNRSIYNRSQLNRSYQSRSRGNYNYNRASRMRSSGMRMRSGGRRR